MTPTHCSNCRTELAPFALACPGCGSLVHAAHLKALAANADAAATSGDFGLARDRWADMLTLLPADSQQHVAVRERIADLSRRVQGPASEGASTAVAKGRWTRGVGVIGVIAAVLFGKLKFLLLGLTKASTVLSMFAFFAVYWSTYGWPLALGLVLSIYIHEMGHVSMLRRFGIQASAPLFIPGVGALVMLRQHLDPLTDAKIGLAGPLWGLGAALMALALYAATNATIWLAIAQLTAFMNLFNLIPIWQLDGSRGVHALSRSQRWTLVAAIALAFFLTEQPLLLIVGAIAVWRAMEGEDGPGNARVLGTFAVLVVALSLLTRGVGADVHSPERDARPAESGSIEWTRRAATQGSADAQDRLGQSYELGRGVPRDPAEAVAWYRKAADQGHPAGLFDLGLMYSKGSGVPLDLVEAYTWMTIASDRAGPVERHGFASVMAAVATRLTAAQLSESRTRAQHWQEEFAARRQ